MEMLEDKSESKIGGPNKTVEVDESMFGHCKVCLIFCCCIVKISFSLQMQCN